MAWNTNNTGGTFSKNTPRGFIRETVPPIDASQKAALNRKGNVFFNEGNIEAARRVFLTTGYSDGLSRIGDYYKKNGRIIDALMMYKAAPNKKKADKIILEAALLIKTLIADE